ncbi:hypothetical protein M758_11G035000 [Ceratodon purpureus]|nr:hypothetical protein M758_11G035000 [Ceratodon purpureus]
MEEYRFSNSLCIMDDPADSKFPPRYSVPRLARPIGEVDRLSEVLEQLPCDLGREGVALKIFEREAAVKSFSQDWRSVIFIYKQFLGVVQRKHEEHTLPADAWVFLNLFAGIPLSDVYHLKVRQPDEAKNVFRDVVQRLERKNPAELPPVLSAAINFRASVLYDLEKDRERCGRSHQMHADGIVAKFHLWEYSVSHGTNPCGKPHVGCRWNKDGQSIARFWLGIILHTCVSLHELWLLEGHYEAALYWGQLCKSLLEKLKGDLPIGIPGSLIHEFMRAVDVFITEFGYPFFEGLESWAAMVEVDCYYHMGKVTECISKSLKLKSKLEARNCYSGLLAVNFYLLRFYHTALSEAEGDSDRKHYRVQINSIDDEILELLDEITGGLPNVLDPLYFTVVLAPIARSRADPDSEFREEEKAERYMNFLQALKHEPTLQPHPYAGTRMLQLGDAELARAPTAPRGLAQLLHCSSACQHSEEALRLAYEKADRIGKISALTKLINACMAFYLCKDILVESQSHHPGSNFVELSQLPQFSGTWLSSAKGPFADVTWNAHYPLELQLVEKLCTLQIAELAEILYGVSNWHDDWSRALSRDESIIPYYYQQLACAYMSNYLGLPKGIQEMVDPMVCCKREQPDIYALMTELSKRSLLASERGRTRALVHQLGPGYLSPETALSLKQFDIDDKVAWDTIQDGQLACGEGTVCVEYSYDLIKSDNSCLSMPIYAYVVARGPKECRFCTRYITFSLNIKSFLDELHSTMSNKENYDETEVTKSLEQLYELLIRPVVDLLPQVPEQNLIFAPHGVLANVPFGLLRDPDKKEFLFERHIISVAPSLRVLGFCKQRYLYLKKLRLVDDTTPIVLVGDPAYSLEHHRLPGAGKEMDSIADVFKQKRGRRCVGIVRRLDASVKAVLDIAEEPSKKNRSQVCIHFAVHGHVTKVYPKGALELTDPPGSTSDLGAEGESISVNKYSPWKKDDGGKEKIDEGITDEIGALELSNCGAATSGSKDGCSDEAGPTSTASDNGASSSGGAGGKSTNENVFCEVGSVSKRRSGDTPPCSKFLRSEDIINCGIEWRAYFVVLSACNTSRGQVCRS